MRNLTGVTLLLLVGLLTLPSAQAQEKKGDRDARIVALLRDTVSSGADIYNKGNEEGCYRLYEGTLKGILAGLDPVDDAKLVKLIEDSKAKASTAVRPSDKAFALREAIDGIYRALAKPVPMAAPKTLWDRLGGEPAVRAVVKDFIPLAASDPKVNFTRNGKYKVDVKDLEEKLVTLISAVSGGPLKYTGRTMKESHEGMEITEAQFNALAGHLIAVLDKYKVPEKEKNELVTIVASTKKDMVFAPKTLWDRLGGEPAVRAVVKDFIPLAAGDPKVNFTRNGKYKVDVKDLEEKLVTLISAVSGGPLEYKGRSMKASHEGMEITQDQFNALAGHLIAVLDKYKVPEKEKNELVAIVASTAKDMVVAKKEMPKKEEPKKEEPKIVLPSEKTLWDRLGGEPAVRAVTKDFIVAAASDPKVNFTRGGKFKVDAKDLEEKMVTMISAVSGGPLKYKGRDMKDSHKGMEITEAEFNATAGHLIDVLKKYKVPQKEIDELIGIVASTRPDIVEKK